MASSEQQSPAEGPLDLDPGEAALVLGVALVSAAGIGWLVGGGIDG